MPNPPAGPEPPDASPGMGSAPSGPSFAPGTSQPRWSQPIGPTPITRPDPETYAPARSRLPAVLTAIAVGVVAIVVVVASLVAHRADHEIAAPRSSRAVESPYVTATKDSIQFTTPSGAGQLTILDHSWQQARENVGTALQVRVRIVCTNGAVDYDPYNFQAFDATGSLFDLAAEEVRGPILGVGVLQPGQQAVGTVAFVIPRGEVTLLMSDDANSVTALKVPD